MTITLVDASSIEAASILIRDEVSRRDVETVPLECLAQAPALWQCVGEWVVEGDSDYVAHMEAADVYGNRATQLALRRFTSRDFAPVNRILLYGQSDDLLEVAGQAGLLADIYRVNVRLAQPTTWVHYAGPGEGVVLRGIANQAEDRSFRRLLAEGGAVLFPAPFAHGLTRSPGPFEQEILEMLQVARVPTILRPGDVDEVVLRGPLAEGLPDGVLRLPYIPGFVLEELGSAHVLLSDEFGQAMAVSARVGGGHIIYFAFGLLNVVEHQEQLLVAALTELTGQPPDVLNTAVLSDDEAGDVRPAFVGLNYPNPFNPSTVIPIRPGSDGEILVSIYSVTGQKVRSLRARGRAGQTTLVSWDGRDDAGRAMGSGVYLCGFGATPPHRMVLLR